MRGQAFVVFKEVSEAGAARNNLDGYPIFGKPMVDIELSRKSTTLPNAAKYAPSALARSDRISSIVIPIPIKNSLQSSETKICIN